MSKSTGSFDRRDFLQTFLISAAGATAMGALPIRTPAAWVSWEPQRASLMLGDDPTPDLELDETTEVANGMALGDPTIARADDGTIWITWSEMVGDDEHIFLRKLDPTSGEWDALIHVNEDQAAEGLGTQAYQPQVFLDDSRVYVVWTARRNGEGEILARSFMAADGTGGEIGSYATAHDCRRPATPGVGGMLNWEESRDGKLRIFGRLPEGSAVELSQMPDRDCRRPAQAVSPTTGEIAVAFDAREGNGHNIHVALCNPVSTDVVRRVQVTTHPASDIAPSLAYSADGRWLWIGWHSNRSSQTQWDIPRWFRLAAMNTETGELFEPVEEPRDKDLEKRETDQGFEFIRLVACPDGGVWVIGRPSHNWCIQKYHGGSWSPIYRLPNDGWGGRGKMASALLDDAGALWVARRDIRAVTMDRVEGAVSAAQLEPQLTPLREARGSRPLTNIEQPVAFPAETDQNTGDEFNFYWGDIHGHSYMSDGMNDVEEHFLRARDLQSDDFFGLTDHDNFVGQRLLNSEYEEHKRVVEHFNDPGNFVTLYAQEWTTPRTTSERGYGHINFYGTDADHPMMDHMDERWDTQAKVTAEAKRRGLFAGPHHVGWTGYRWDETDPEVIKFVEMCSVHGVFEYEGNEPIPHRGNYRGHFVQDGLASGLKFGFAGGSDQHGLIWHHRMSWKRNVHRAGVTCVLAPDLTRESIVDAFNNRRIYATTGVKVRLGFRINGHLMGSVIESDGPPQFHVDLISPTDIKWVELVRNNETIVRYGGESLHTFFRRSDETCPIGEECWYYLRVILEDNNMAWTSPIWVTRTA